MAKIFEHQKLLIGITGLKGSGKDTIANYIVKNYGFTKKSLAEPLKNACISLFDLTENQLENDKETPSEKWFGLTPREIMQFVGTDLLRKQMFKLNSEIKENIFIHNFKNWYENGPEKNLVVISDVRFQNEVDYIKSQNGFIIKVFYNSTPKEPETLFEKIKNFLGINEEHESELGNFEYDFFVNNGYDYQLSAVHSQVDSILKKINGETTNK